MKTPLSRFLFNDKRPHNKKKFFSHLTINHNWQCLVSIKTSCYLLLFDGERTSSFIWIIVCKGIDFESCHRTIIRLDIFRAARFFQTYSMVDSPSRKQISGGFNKNPSSSKIPLHSVFVEPKL